MVNKRSRKIIKRTLIIILVVFVVIQFIRVDRDNPIVQSEKDFVVITSAPDNVSSLLYDACYDCHSFTTDYPWYSQIAPISWWLKDHVDEGREHLNFSTWGDYSNKKADHKLEECVEEIEESEMPLNSYTWTHSEAKLTIEQRNTLKKFFNGLRNTDHNNDIHEN